MDFWHDARYALRRLIQARWFTLAAVSALAIGIGANATGFTITNAIMLRGLPFEDPEQIVAVFYDVEGGGNSGLSYPEIEDVLAESRTLTGLVGLVGSDINVADEGNPPERIPGAYVSAGFFQMLRVEPVLGRSFTEADDEPGAAPVTMLGYSVWQNRFGGSPSVLGQTVRVNSLPATIVGVMPEGMRFVNNTDIWIPKDNLPPESEVENRFARGRNVIGRLAPGVTIEQAREEMRILGQRFAEEYPEESGVQRRLNVQDFNTWFNGGEINTIFGMVMGAVVFVLLIACVNVANLMLAKSSDRTREIAVRVSMGATRGRIVRQLLVEALIIALLAGVVGLVLGLFGVRWFDGVTQDVGKPYWMVFSLDPIVFAYLAAVCLGTALVFGLAPALQVSKTDVNEVLKEGTRGGSGGVRMRRWASVFVVCEIVMTIVLLSGAAFFARSFANAYALSDELDTDGLLTMRVYLPLTKYPEPGQQLEIIEDLGDRLPGATTVSASALANVPPLVGGGRTGVELDGRVTEPGADPPLTTLVTVSEGYFETLGLPVLEGRDFNRADGEEGNENVVVNQRFVEIHLGGGDALGRQVRVGAGSNTDPSDGWASVIGVVPNVRQAAIEETDTDPIVYRPIRGSPTRTFTVLARAQGDAAGATSEIREIMRTVEPDVPVYDVMTMDQRLAEQRWPFRVFGIMFSAFAGSALLLSAVGLYSITAHSVIQRTREFGIRVSLGAEPKEIRRLALRRVLIQLAIGVPIGVAGAFGVGNLLEGLLVQITAGDPTILASVALLLVAIAVVACLLPARRAAAVDPVTALRVE